MIRFTRTLILLFCAFTLAAVSAGAQTANFTGTPIAGCSPLVVQFTSTSTGNITSYSWNLGNNVTSAYQNPSTTYSVPGTYTVTLTVTGPNGSNTKTLTNYITVYSQPTVSFTANDTAGCPPLTTQFTSTSTPNAPGGMTYTWDFGDGYTSSVANPPHTYAAPGYYNVTLVVTNSVGCTKTLIKPNYIHVYSRPAGNFTVSGYNPCHTPATVTFTNTSTGSGPYTATWNFGDNTTGAGNSTPHTYNNPGTYTVTMIVTDVHGCKDTVVKPAIVNVNPNASFTASAPGCVHDSVFFVNTTAGSNGAAWDFGDSYTGTGNYTNHVYAAAGTYTVRMIAAHPGGCVDTVLQSVTIYAKPTANFTGSPVLPCPAPSTVQFTNSSTNGLSYEWFFGDGSTSAQTNPPHTYAVNGSYTVKLIVTNANGCKDTLIRNNYINIYNMIPTLYANQDKGCIPLTVSFSSALTSDTPTSANYPSPVATYLWDFGDGSPTSALAAPTHIFTTAGTFTVTLTMTTANGCSTTTTRVIHTGTTPTASFYASPTVQCTHQQIYFVNTSTGGANVFTWDFGDGSSTSSTGNVTHNYLVPGTYSVTLHAFNNGCQDDTTIANYITVNPPNANFYDSIYCAPSTTVAFHNLSIGATSQIWYFGDNTTSTLASPPPHTYPSTGTYMCRLVTFNSVYGCSDTITLSIQLFNPQIGLTASDTTICKGTTIQLISSYTGLANTYSWRVDNQLLNDTLANIDYTFNQTGYHTVTLYIKDYLNCLDTFRRTNYVLAAKPTPAFTGIPVTGCIPLSVTFTDQSAYTVGTLPGGRNWDYGDGGTAFNNNSTSTHVYTTAGVYHVNLVVTDNFGCSDSLIKNNYIHANKPVADFIADDTTACIGQVISFINSSTGASNLTYNWTFGDNTAPSAAAQPTHTYSQAGNFTVRLIVTDTTGCRDTLTRTGYINISKPTASFTLSDTLAVCPPLLVHFTNTSAGAAAYTWDLGNGNISTLTNPVNTYSAAGTYTVTLIAINNSGCIDSAKATIKVLGYAGALSYTPLSGCSPLAVHFTASISNVPNLVWDFSDGITAPATGLTINHTYMTPGVYVPKLIFSDGLGCTNSSSGIDTIKIDGIIPGFSWAPPCEKTTMQLTDTSHGFFSPVSGWQWTFDNNTTSTLQNPTHVYSGPGTFPVTLVVTNANGCKDTLKKSLTIYSLPAIHAAKDTAVCPGDIAPLSATGGISYTWTPNTNLSCNNCANANATPTVPTVYVVTGTDVHGCANKDSVHVSIQNKTTSAVATGGEICQGQSIQLTASGAQVYKWSPSATLSNSQIPNPVASPTVTTNYMVIATEGSCAPDTNYVRVVVHLRPAVSAGPDQTIIAGSSIILQASGTGIDHYEWLTDASLSCTTCTNPSITPKKTTTYYITAYNNYGCTDTDEVVIHVLCDKSQVFMPNTFTPNNDGQNDYFFPRGSGIDKITSFRVYSRWGELLYERRGIDVNDEKSGWDGTYKGAVLPPDVYVYVMEAVCDTGEPVKWKGDITLMR